MTTHYLLLCLLLTCISCHQPQNANLPIPAEDTTAITEESVTEVADAIATPVVTEVVIDTLKTDVKPVPDVSIDGKWELVLFNKVKPDSILYPRAIPFLLIDEAAGKFSGSSGCNRIGGTLIKTEWTIQLSKIISTPYTVPGVK
jgi:heat shock protein HslJ